MKPFVAPLDDILFSLAHVARADTLPDWDAQMTAEIAGHFAGFAEAELAPLDEPGDRQGCRLDQGRVRMPDGFAAAYNAYAAQGWPGLTVPEQHGGQGMGAVMLAATSEIFSGANHSLQMVTGLVPGAVRVLTRFGSPDQQARHIPDLASGRTLATMCLTEPGAGSDLGRIRCRAVKTGDHWQISGEKIFISGGDQDLSERILHLVLARSSDAGVKGLSLFLCPCTGSDGRRNAVSVTRIEDKLGLHASPTCQLAFDGARAELIGSEGQGLAAMFTMMNHARTDVALQGVAHAARAHDIARSYAMERGQGRKADGSAAMLADHADVQRMLTEIDATAMGTRAIAHLAVVAMDRGDAPALVEALTPIAKVAATEGGIRAADLGIQVLGGYGYLSEYRLEQTWRDARITAIYEGANGVLSRMFASRLLGGPAGEALAAFLSEDSAGLAPIWQRARAHVQAADDPAPLAHDMMQLTILTLQSVLHGRIAAAADHHPDPARLRRLATQAIASAQAFAPAHAARMGA